MELYLIKRGGMFYPASEDDREICRKIKSNTPQRCNVVQPKERSYEHHKKFFAMLGVGFDAFEPAIQEYKGFPVQKSLERFRKDCIIAAGYYDVVANINGDVRAEAKSISFKSMGQEEFDKLYNAVCNVLLQRVLKNYTRDDLDSVVEKLLRF